MQKTAFFKRRFHLFFFLFFFQGIAAQNPNTTKGVIVTSQVPADSTKGDTYAIIMGVSKYKSPNIKQLQFADADARLFRDFLLSPAGGNIKPENINLLLNDKATMADFLSGAKGWLKGKDLKKNDRLYLYFSGHGDADAGNYYFLTYDCTPEKDEKNYAIGGAVNMHYIKTMFIKPQLDKGVEVIIIMDACRTNELPGGKEGQLSFANNLTEERMGQIMLFATGPGQVSIESPTIYNGHGLFTFYLVDGLAGAADKNEFTGNQNGEVSLSEIDSYVKTFVRKKAETDFSTAQQPVICCSEKNNTVITKVDNPTFAAWEKKTAADENPFAMNTKSMSARSIGDWSKNDSLQISIYNQFVEAVKDEKIIADAYADSLYNELEKKWPGNSLTEEARYSLATKYLNFCQEKINLFLSGKGIIHVINMEKEADTANSLTGVGEQISKLKTLVTTGFDVAAKRMGKAVELLQHEPELLESIRPKNNFLKTMAAYADKTNNLKNVLELCRNTIAGDPASPAGYLLMGWIYKDMENDSCEYYFRKAAGIAPKWPYPVNGLGNYYFSENKYDSALHYFNKAIELDGFNNDAYRNIGMMYYKQSGMNYDPQSGMSHLDGKALESAKNYFAKALKINPCDCYANEYLGKVNQDYIMPNSTGIQQADSTWFNVAKNKYLKAIACDSNFAAGYQRLAALYSLIKNEHNALAILQSCTIINPKNADGFRNLGNYYLKTMRDTTAAETNFKTAINLDPATGSNHFSLARLYKKQQNKNKAIAVYQNALDKIGNNKALFNEIGNIYFDSPSSQFDSAIVYYKKALAVDSTVDYVNYNLGQVYLNKNSGVNNDSAVYYFSKAVNYNPYRWSKENPVIADYLYDKKDFTRAKIYYKNALARPAYTINRDIERLVSCLIEEKNFTEAENTLNQYLKPENNKMLFDKLTAEINKAAGKN